MQRILLSVLALSLSFFASQLHALSITLDGTRTLESGTDCEIATYSFGINETWNNMLLDLYVEVIDQDNENTNGDCVGVMDNLFTVFLRDKDAAPDDIAYVDAIFTVVQRGTTIPVFLDRITATGFDLDNTAGTGTDDIYLTAVEAPYLSDQSLVTFSQGNFPGGHDFHFKGKSDGDCTDTPTQAVPECRAAASWVGGDTNQISTIRARFQNDNAYGGATNNTSRRKLQLSFQVSHAEEVIADTTDRGDAPASYGDASHPVTSLTTLLSNGLAPDNDPNTSFSNGDADDNDTGNTGATGIAKYDDEDAVTYNGLALTDQTLNAGATETMDVLTFGSGFLSAWIDLNIDGDFADPGEQILTDVAITGSTVQTTPVSVVIPQTASDGNTYVRFRFNNNAGVNSSQPGLDGEVEDYRVAIASMDPTFNMVKTASPAVITAAGTITYTFTFNNTGNATLSNLTISDPDIDNGTLSGCPIASLSPGQSASCTATRAVSQVQIDNGVTLSNTATPTGTNPLGGAAIETTTADNTVLSTITPTFTIAVDKSQPANADEDGSGDISAGDTLTYTVTSTNTGTATVSNLLVSDPMINPSSASCASVAPGGSCELVGSLIVAAGDTGTTFSNTATAVSDQTGQVSDTESVVVPAPSLSVSKALPTNADEDGSTDVSLNDTLSYTVTATNDGAANLTNVVVEDLLLTPSSVTCLVLAPAATCVLSGSYVVDTDDVTLGTINNTATANSTQTVQVDDSNSVTVPAPAISIDKAAPANADNDGSTDISVGDVLTYTVTATNTGLSTLTNVIVNDPMLTPDTATCGSLSPNQDCVLVGTYTVNAADATAGTIDNTASVNTDQTALIKDTETVTVPAPALSVDKAAPVNADNDSSTDVSAGDVLTYTITATNTGTATLTNVAVSDSMLSPSSSSCAMLAANQACVLSGTYTVSAADVASGSISNTATADSDQTSPVSDTEVTVVPLPELSIDKPAPVNADNDSSGDISAGDVLTYTVTATNTGSAVLGNVVVNDPMLTPNTSTCATLAVNATCVLSGTYTVTTADVTAAEINNTATASSDQTSLISDSELVLLAIPGLTVNKAVPVNADEDGSGDITVGDTLSYTITATNSGTAVLTNVIVSDPLITPATSSCANVAAGGSCVFTGSYTVALSDVAAGTINNTATADSDQTPEASDTRNTSLGVPALSVVKPAPSNADEDGSGDISAGDTLTYTVTATNNGATNLTNVVVSDPLLAPASASCALLAIGADCVLSGNYTVVAADVGAGEINNTAAAVSDQTASVDTTQTVILPSPAHSIDKPAPANADEDGSGDISAGDTLTYTVTATNTGTATLTGLVVTDPEITPDSTTCGLVAAGSTCVLTGSYQVTASDVANGSVVNIAYAVSQQSPQVDDTHTVVVPDPLHVIDKSAPANADEDGSTDVSAGDTLTYVVTATNTGAATLTNMVVTDPMLTPDSITCGVLTPGQSCQLTGSYVVTAADVAAGTIVNVAGSESDQTVLLEDTETVSVPTPGMIIAKPDPVNADEDGTGDISAGDTLTYTVTVTNNATAMLTNVIVTDPLLMPGSEACTSVAAGASCTLTGIYSVTAADVSAGSISNTASGNSDQTAAIDATNTINLLLPELSVDKPAPANADEDGSGDISVGDTLTYTITATNNGTATLTNVTVLDPMISPNNVQCATVSAGASCVLTGSYSVVAADISAGQIDNTATADSDQTGAVTDSESVPVFSPALSLVKSAPANADQDGSGDVSVGDVLTYTVVATNSGGATLTNVAVNDPMIVPATANCALVVPNATCELTGTYTVVANDVVAGSIDNMATAESDQTGSVSDSESVPVGVPSHVLDKAAPTVTDADGSGDVSAGDTLTYVVTATNNGAATLTNLIVNDSMISPASVTCAIVTVGDSCVLSGTYLVTAGDIAAGSIDNVADSDSDQTGAQTASQSITLGAPALVLDKAAPVNADEDGNGAIGVGDTLTYTITATNSGTAALTNVIVNDSMITPATLTCPLVVAGDTCVLTGSYTVTSADVSAGSLSNTADADSDQTGPETDTEVVTLQNPSHTINKVLVSNADEDGSADISVNDTLTYTVTATNNSGVTLTSLLVSDPMLTPGSVMCAIAAAGDSCVLTGTYVVAPSDVAAGVINNTATAQSDQTQLLDDTLSVTLPAPSMGLHKAVPVNNDLDNSGDISAGDILTYIITASNTGTATLTNVEVNDALVTPASVSCATLVPGDTCVLTGTYMVSAADVNNGAIDNTADTSSDQLASIYDSRSVVLLQPSLALDKAAPANADQDGSGDISEGDVLSYTITATNNGGAALTNVVVGDVLINPAQVVCASVVAGDSCVLTGDYTVTASDVAAGVINNTADAISDQTSGVTDSESVVVPAPLHTLVKSAPLNADDDGSGDISAGDVLTYTITATNTGTAVLTNLNVSDPMIFPAGVSCAIVAVGGDCVLSGSYTVTAADVTAGTISNTATSVSDQSAQVDDTQVISLNAPSLSINKPAPVNADEDGSTDISLGDTLTYTITATNNGSSNLTNVVVNDPLIVPGSTSCSTLTMGASCVLTGTYVVTAGDVVNGNIANTATANSVQTGAVTDNEDVPVPAPQLSLNKAAPANNDLDGSGDVSAGDVLGYTVTATNTGTAILTDVLVNDPRITPSDMTCAMLLPGASCVLTGDYTVTAADVAAGVINNTATVDSTQTALVDDSENVVLAQPDLAVSKAAPVNADEDGSGDISQGDTLTYTVTATNTGSATLTNLVISDPLISPASVTCASVPAAASCVLSGTYTVTAANVSSGVINNTASANSDQAGPVDDSHNLVLLQPLLALDKAAPVNSDEDGSGDVSQGDTLSYTVTATNTGGSTLTNVVVNDPLITPSTQNCGVVVAGDTCVLSGTTVVTAADVVAGVINNTAEANSTQTAAITDSESVVVPSPLHTLVKSLPVNADNDGSGEISVGDILTYTITATNTGSATLTGLSIADPLINPSNAQCALVTPGDVCVLSGTYTVTAADVTAGIITNTAGSVSDQSQPVEDTQSVNLNAPGLTIDKPLPVNADEDGSTDISVGDTLTYTITATNNGSSNLTNVVVTDALITPDAITCATLTTGATCVLTGTYVVTANDVVAAGISNVAAANSDQTPEVNDSVNVPVPDPQLVIDKSAPAVNDLDGSTDVSAGDVLTYTVTATNSGSAILTNVVVDDPQIVPSSAACALLAPGAVCILTGDYTVTTADVAAGVIDNTATAGSDQTALLNDTETVVVEMPELVVSKAAPANADEDGSSDVSAGDTLTYTITATNTGTAILTGVVVTDALIVPDTVTCASVAAGASCVLSGVYTVTAANVASGVINNTASAVSVQAGPVDDGHNMTLLQPLLALDKAAPANADEDGSGDVSAGDTLSYSVTATNTGSSTLTNVIVSDPLVTPSTISCGVVSSGDNCVLTGDYMVTAADVVAGVINNTAIAESDQTQVIADSESVMVPVPLHTLVKAAPVITDNDNSADVSAGDTLTYTITATNTGAATLTNLQVSDAMLTPASAICAVVTPGQTCVLIGSYTVTGADIIAGAISNTAASVSDQSAPVDDTQIVNLNTPSLVVDKPAPVNQDEDGSTDVSPGDTLTYTIVATNNGMATLTNVVVSDPMITPDTISCASLTAGADCILVGSYTVTQADVAAGEIVNQAVADSDQTQSVSDDETVSVPQPQLAVVKSAPVNGDQDGSADISVGDVLTYTVTATNTGMAMLTNVLVNDAMITPASVVCDLLAPGASCVLSGAHTVSVADVAAAVIQNSATANSDQVGPAEDTHTIVVPVPGVDIVKSVVSADADGSGDISAGDVLTYTVTATNTGSATLTGVTVSDAMLTPADITCSNVPASGSCVLSGDYTVTDADVMAVSIVNAASVVSDQTPPVPVEHTVVLPEPSLIVSKASPSSVDADGSGDVSAGDTLTYVITATNNGSAALTNVMISDPLLTPASAGCVMLLPSESCELSGTYLVSSADVAAGEIVNIAAAESDQSPPVEDTQVQNLAGPAHSMVKALSGNADEDISGDISAGDTLTYTITVSNSGNATLTNVLISDPLLTPDTRQCATLVSGDLCVLTGTYSVTSQDVTAGLITNTAAALSDQTAELTETHELVVPAPAYTLSKSMPVNQDEDGSGDISAGDTLIYTITARNTGMATLTGVQVTDAMISPSTAECDSLAASQECVLIGNYSVTAADVSAGVISNTAGVDSDQLETLEDTVTINLNEPALALEKLLAANADEDSSGDISAGDTLTYTITATNNGSSALTNVQIDDAMLTPASQTCALLAPGSNCVLSGSYLVTEANIADGQIVNAAGVVSDQTPPAETTVTTGVNSPALTLVKTLAANGDEDGTGDVTLGDTLQYSIVATNTGTATLTDVIITDGRLSPNAANCATLVSQSSCELQGYYIVTAADVEIGQVVNTAAVNSDQLPPVEATHTAAIDQPVLTLVKSAPVNADNDASADVTLNDVLTYTVTARNTGATALSNVVVSDALLVPASNTCALLAVGGTCTLTGEYTVAANDVEAGEIVNVASVDSDQTPPVEASHTQIVIAILPPQTTDNTESDLPLGIPVTVNVLGDDSDPENNIDPTTVQIINPETGEQVTSLVVAGEGSWNVDALTGEITFTPEQGYVGSPTPVQYLVSDTTGLVSNLSTVTLDFEASASLTGTVWLDIDRDGEIDPVEPVMPGWTLNLYNDDGVLVATTVTDEDGTYAVLDLIPAVYTVHFLNDAGVFMAEATTGGVLEAGQTIDLPLPIDPSGIVYDSVTREPVPDVTLQLVNSNGVVIDPVCLNANQQNQVTQADGYYAFDVFPDAHSSCPLEDVYSIQIASLPATYEIKLSEFIPPNPAVFDGAAVEENCTVDSIPGSGDCEIQMQPGAPQSGEETRYYMSFRLAAGDRNVIFNHIPVDPYAAAALAGFSLQKNAARGTVSTGDVLFYSIRLQNSLAESVSDVSVSDDLPNGFRLVPDSVVVTTFDDSGNAESTARVVTTGIDPVVFTGLSIPALDEGDIEVTYAVRVGAALVQGQYTNTAVVSGGGVSNTGAATVSVVADPALDNATLVGKVFHDRDGDGYQDSARATGVTLSSDYFANRPYDAGELRGRSDPADQPDKVIINLPFTTDNSFVVTTAEGSMIAVDHNAEVTYSHVGQRAHGLTAQDIQVSTRVTDAVPALGEQQSVQKTRVLEVTLSNLGVNEEGIPGVRLASVTGIVVETDQFGRFHIPDVDAGDSGRGQQTIVKLDVATIPHGAVLTTENPRVIRVTNSALNTMRFGVRLPQQDSAVVAGKPRGAVEVNLGSVFFDTDMHNIRADQIGVVEDIIKHIKALGSGRILIEAFTDSRQSQDYNIALARRRALSIERALSEALGVDLMRNVVVDVDTSAYKKENKTINRSDDNAETSE